jgi:hypothetical protein
MSATEVFALFPTPVSRVAAAIDAVQAKLLAQRFASRTEVTNAQSMQLAHSRLLAPGEDDALDAVIAAVGPHVQVFGALLFGETLRWLVKESWVNVLQPGGRQALHNHANSFVSGILYLTTSDASAQTVFARGMGGPEFVLRNTHADVAPGAYDAQKWVAPAPQPGDLLLFPSWLLHEVPPNAGGERITIAFNAIPHRLDAWGYTLSFAP